MARNITVAILSGGKSRRMGTDKAFLPFEGVPMIERVIATAKPFAKELLIIANDKPAYERYGCRVCEDIIKGMGPLSGLYTAFNVTRSDLLLLVATDMPTIHPDIVRLISDNDEFAGDVLLPVAFGKEQGLLAAYRRSAIEKFSERILQADIQFDEFRNGLEKTFIPEEELRLIDPALSTFRNVNRPEDLLHLP